MPRMMREALMARFRAMVQAGQPILGGGAGTGLSAKCEEAGGIDLIVIYNSGRYRMAGRGSLAGMLAPDASLFEVVADFERKRIIEALEAVNYSQTEAAEALHIPLSTLNQKIKRLNIDIKRRPPA